MSGKNFQSVGQLSGNISEDFAKTDTRPRCQVSNYRTIGPLVCICENKDRFSRDVAHFISLGCFASVIIAYSVSIPVGGLGIAPMCLRCSGTLKHTSGCVIITIISFMFVGGESCYNQSCQFVAMYVL